jgi:hypothetical protein
MDKIVYIGGIGSDSRQVEKVARALTAQFKKNVIPFSFSGAYKNMALLARLAPECLIITHATGLLLVKNLAPKEVVAIAPPMPTLPSLLLWRLLSNAFALFGSSKESNERHRKIWNHYLCLLKEYALRPHYNGPFLRDVSAFNAARLAVEIVASGGKVTIGFMENDKVFPDAALHPHMDIARAHGVKIYENILGYHDEFVFYPQDVLTQLRYLEDDASLELKTTE